MRNLKSKLIVVLITIIGIAAFESCEKEDNLIGDDNQLRLKSSNESNYILNTFNDFNLSEKCYQNFMDDVDFDENERIIGFEYLEILSELEKEDVFNAFLVKLLSYTSSEISINGVSVGIGVSVELPKAQIYVDKRNWRRPGCKPKTGAICVIYV